MSKKKMFVVGLVAVVALSACSLSGPSEQGTVTVNFRPGASSKALGDPVDFLPLFSSATLTISGPDMADVSVTVSAGSGVSSASLEVPAGNDRVVRISAVPNWTLTQIFYPGSAMITFAKAYGGSATVNVSARGTTNVHISLGVTETRIVLPDNMSNSISFVDTIQDTEVSGSIGSVATNMRFAFDRYGRFLLVSGVASPVLSRYTNLLTYESSFPTISYSYPFAYSRPANAAYFAVDNELHFVDLTDTSVNETLILPMSFSAIDAVAVDPEGFVYIAGLVTEIDYFVKKLYVADSMDVTELVSVSYESLGLAVGSLVTNLTVEDMQVKDGMLYIAAGEHDAEGTNGTVHHGKIVEARLSDLAKVREIGWSAATPIPSPSTQFYGPKRFLAIVPRKLIVADEGNSTGAYGGDLNRVVEVDLDSWSFSGVGLEGMVSFFSTYQC